VALNYEEVQKRLERSISSLKRMSTLFLATITGNTEIQSGQFSFVLNCLFVIICSYRCCGSVTF
jgi:hypothetical protein